MKIPLLQLPQNLAKKLAPIYVVSGDESLLAQDAIDLIRSAAEKAGFIERERMQAEGNDWGKLFYANTQTLSLFSAKRILELDLTLAKQSAATSKILQEYSQNLSEDLVVIIRMNKLDSKSEQSSWYKALDRVGIMVPLWPISLDQLPNWILQRAKKMNLQLTPHTAERLAVLVEGNLLAAAQELEKLTLLQLSDRITDETIEQTVSDNSHYDIFSLVDSALAGNISRSLHILDNLAAEAVEPTLILWALSRELRTMSELAKQMLQGVTLSSLYPKFRIFDKRQPNVRAFLQRHNQTQCWSLLKKAAQIDRMIKGAEKDNVWDAFKQMIVQMG